MTPLGRLSIVGARSTGTEERPDDLIHRSRPERTLPVVCRNLGKDCPEERDILGRQILARAQAEAVLRTVEALPFKGVHLAHELYPSPGLRDMGDIDLLVRPGRVREADAALRALGYLPEREPSGEPGPFLNSAIYWREDSFPVHLHWKLLNGSLPHFMIRMDEDEIWRDASGGRMSPHHVVISLCEHALKHSYDTLLHLTDIELAGRSADWDRVADCARRWGLERAVVLALLLLRDLSGVRSPGLEAFRGRSPGWEGELLLHLARRRRWNGLSALGYLSMTRGLAGKLRFVREALAPSHAHGALFRTKSFGGRVGKAAGRLWAGVISSRPGPS